MSCALLSRPSLSREAALAAGRSPECGPAANPCASVTACVMGAPEAGTPMPGYVPVSERHGSNTDPVRSLFPELAGPSGAKPGIGPAILFQGRGALTEFLNQLDGKE